MKFCIMLTRKGSAGFARFARARAQIANTMKCIHTIQFKDDDFEIATATTPEEIKQLGQSGFVKYDEMKGMHFYRKPKKLGGLVLK